MPWVNKSMCTGCGACVAECPVEAISLDDHVAVIDEAECIRCGRCHDVCPEEAVRHDGERVPQEVEANIQWAKRLMGHFETDHDRAALLERLMRHFQMKKKVIEKTAERLRSFRPGEGPHPDASPGEADSRNDRNAPADS